MGHRLMPHSIPMPVLLAMFVGILLALRVTGPKP
jgi:hypothetical protein